MYVGKAGGVWDGYCGGWDNGRYTGVKGLIPWEESSLRINMMEGG